LKVSDEINIRVVINGDAYQRTVPARRLLSDFIRHDIGLTGTHVGCEHGVCGACNVLIDGTLTRSCLTLAAQVNGCELATIEGLAPPGQELHAVQRALLDEHGFQCGFCTPGVALAIDDLLRRGIPLDDETLREELSGNLCRCTGYGSIVRAVHRAAELLADEEANRS
jgi:aerobic carbon-monoxide dehydrogenase small subunit